jgi:hypothetical protein
MKKIYSIVFILHDRDSETRGLLDSSFTDKRAARRRMRRDFTESVRVLKWEHDLDDCEIVRKSNFCTFSADYIVSYKVEIIETILDDSEYK